jgi:hypothetical protein
MDIFARIENHKGHHLVILTTNGREQAVTIAARPACGSSANGGELLFLSLATGYCKTCPLLRGTGRISLRDRSIA